MWNNQFSSGISSGVVTSPSGNSATGRGNTP
jgi:hypothetical protein